MKKLLVLALALLPGTALGFSFGDTIGSGDPWTAANAAQIQTFLTAIDDCAAGEAVTGNGANVTPSICIDFLTAAEGNAAYATGVGDCTSGDCLDGTSDGGTQITLYDAAATVVLDNAAGTLDISRPVTATSFTADDPGDGSRGVELVDNTATCADPTAGSTSICTIGGEPFTRDTGGTSREILYTAGGDYGDFTCSAGTCTVDASAVAISTDVSGLGTGVATFLGTPSSANLAAAVTGETGTGALVFAASPVLTTPDLGTPSALTLTSATGLPASTGLTGVVAVANGGTGAAPGAGGDDVLIGTSATTSTWAPMPTSGTNGCDGTGEALQYNTATNSFDCLTGLGAGGTVDDISGDTGTTTGANVTIAGGTNGIDTSVSGDTLTMSLDLTEINSATFGSGTFTALTFNAGATDPTFTMGSDSVTVTNAATFDFEADSISTADLATEVRSMYWGAAGLSADGTNCADPAEVTINSGPILYTIICTDNDASTIYGSVTMPDSWDGGTVTFEHIYIQTAADTAALAGDIMAQCRGNGETPSSTWGTEVAIDDAGVVGSNSNDHTTSGAVTPAGTCAAGDTLYWRYQLDATGTATAVSTLHHVGFKMEYTSNVGD